MNMDLRELEGRIIACMLSDRDLSLYLIKNTEKDFFFWKHIQDSFELIRKEVLSNEDSHGGEDGLGLFMQVKSMLHSKKVQKSYIADIASGVGDFFNIAEAKKLLEVLKEEYQKRMLDQMATAIKSSQTASDKRESINKYKHVIEAGFITGSTLDVNNVGKDLVERLSSGEDDMSVVKFGDTKLDKYLLFTRGAVVVLAARPAVGKTSFALQKALQLAKNGYNVKMYSREMLKEELFHKLIGAEMGISQYQLRDMDRHQKALMYEEMINNLSEVKGKLYLDDEIGTIGHIEADMTIEKRVKNIDVFIIDYLQLIRHEKFISNDNSRVADISSRLKTATLKNKTRLILLSQLNRGIENRKVKKPMLSDLRDSGQIEQDANAVLFLDRPSLYADENGEVYVTEKEKTWVRNDLANLIIAKNRIGITGEIEMTFTGESQTFEEVL